MKLGLLTAPFPDTPLAEVADWASGGRLRGAGDRLLAAVHRADPPLCRHQPHRRRRPLGRARPRRSSPRCAEQGPRDLRRSATIPNPLHPDPAHREAVIDHLKQVIVAAGADGRAGWSTPSAAATPRRPSTPTGRTALEGLARHRRPRPRPRRQARLRELPDDLQLRRMAGRAQHRLFAADLAPDPRSLGRRRRHELRPLAPGLADDRPGAASSASSARTCCTSTPRT